MTNNNIIIKNIICPICNKKMILQSILIDTHGKHRELCLTCNCGTRVDWSGKREITLSEEDWNYD